MIRIIHLFTIGIICSLFLVSSIAVSESVLWDLLIDISFEKNPLEIGDIPVVIGTVTDHAGKPVSDAEVKIRFDKESVVTFTNSSGVFKNEFSQATTPGRYIVNIVATTDDKKIGISRTDIQVKGHVPITANEVYNLALINSEKFENVDPKEFENDPIALIQYNYYQELKEQYLKEKAKEREIEEQQKFIEQKRELARKSQQAIIEEKNPGAGTYSGWKYDRFVDNLDSSVKNLFIDQLNYTIKAFTEAQIAMEGVLENGGTIEEARQAYYEKAAVPRELMESYTTINGTDSDEAALESNPVDTLNAVSEESVDNSTAKTTEFSENLNVTENGTIIKLSEEVTTLFLNINGAIIEFIVNGTQVIQVTNSTQI